MRHKLVVAVALSVGLVGACYKSKAPSGAAPLRNEPAAERGPQRDYSATLADPVGFLPSDSEFVIALDADQLRRSALWTTIEPRLMKAAGGGLQVFKDRCGFDPVAAVRSATIGLKMVDGSTAEGVMVVTGFDRARLMGCLSEAAKGQASGTMSIINEVVTIPGKGDDPSVVLTFVDATTVVARIGRAASAEQLQRTLDAGSPLRSSPTFVTMLAMVDQGASMWMVLNGNSKAFDAVAAMGFRPQAVFGSISVVSGMSTNLRVRLDGAAKAAQLATLAQGQLSAASNFFERLDVVADDADVVVTAAMTDAQVTTLATMLGSMLGGP